MPVADPVIHDIVLVGGGGAGIRAAIAAVEEDPTLTVGMVSKVYPMRSHTVSAEGGAAGVVRTENDDLDSHAYDTIKGSDFLADQDVVEAFVADAPKELLQLEHWGCPWSRDPDGRVATRIFGGMTTQRTLFAADKTGFHMLHALFQTSLKYDRIVRYDEEFVTSLLVHDGRVRGVTALNLHTGKFTPIFAKAVIVCTGGAGRVFPFTTNALIKTGDGMAMAYRAGVPLKDMEFVQYHPTGLPGTGILITEASRSEGGYLFNKEQDRFLRNYVPAKMELAPRDLVSRAIIEEIEGGRAFEGKYGHYVHLDLTHLGEAKINERLPFVRELATKYVGIDPVKQPIPIRPVVHYCMGGIDTDVNAATLLPGLYAAGEVASVSINGANRLGSNSLTELIVFGARGGRHAVEYIRGLGDVGSVPDSLARDEWARIEKAYLQDHKDGERTATIRREMQLAMEKGCGVYRRGELIRETRDKLSELRERFGKIRIDDRNSVFNTDLTAAMELDFMLDVAQTIAEGALKRTESRGAHQRRDYGTRDDQNFLTHTLAYRTEGGPRIEYRPVTITRWQPEERKY
ncbi:MAG: FAD-binding protein [Myxococcota bacterium]